MALIWLTTAPHPWKKAHRHGADQGQIGWKLHAVEVPEGSPIAGSSRLRAACGLTPKHGWGLDLFIDNRCEGCERVMDELLGGE